MFMFQLLFCFYLPFLLTYQLKNQQDREERDRRKEKDRAAKEKERRDKAAMENAKKEAEAQEESKRLDGRMLFFLRKSKDN